MDWKKQNIREDKAGMKVPSEGNGGLKGFWI